MFKNQLRVTACAHLNVCHREADFLCLAGYAHDIEGGVGLVRKPTRICIPTWTLRLFSLCIVIMMRSRTSQTQLLCLVVSLTPGCVWTRSEGFVLSLFS
jgi:hypothetical protein